MEMGEELRDLLKEAKAPRAAGAGEHDRDLRGVPGVPGGVTPLPLAREAPITLTSSLTETPWSSGGMSLLKVAESDFLCESAAGEDFLE